VVSAWQVTTADTWAVTLWPSAYPQATPEMMARQVAEDAVRAATDHARSINGDLEVRSEVVHGSPALAVASASEDAGLVVVGARGLGGFTGLLMGSVSRAVMRTAACPVAVVRVPRAAAA
jgi:nucleotide-binding universal stress UspA family protein